MQGELDFEQSLHVVRAALKGAGEAILEQVRLITAFHAWLSRTSEHTE